MEGFGQPLPMMCQWTLPSRMRELCVMAFKWQLYCRIPAVWFSHYSTLWFPEILGSADEASVADDEMVRPSVRIQNRKTVRVAFRRH